MTATDDEAAVRRRVERSVRDARRALDRARAAAALLDPERRIHAEADGQCLRDQIDEARGTCDDTLALIALW